MLAFLFFSCAGDTKVPDKLSGKKLAMSHSSLLAIAECDDYTVVDIADPWGESIMVRYLLVSAGDSLPSNMPDGVLLRTPLEDVVLFSGVHALLLEELGADKAIAGVCDARYIYSEAVEQGLHEGVIADCGNSLNADSEAIMQLSPDALFVLPYENVGYGKLKNLDIPFVMCADYMETSPLGCAEWMRFYGRLLGCSEYADSLFAAISMEYEALCNIVSAVDSRPRLMCELKGSSAWYVPCGESTMGRMYADAGADYLFSSYKGGGSVPLSFETVLSKAIDADVWLLKYNALDEKTLSSLLADFRGYSLFKSYKDGNIYACNTHRKHLFEESAFHPERLLKELIAIFHPELMPDYTLKYYEKMRRR